MVRTASDMLYANYWCWEGSWGQAEKDAGRETVGVVKISSSELAASIGPRRDERKGAHERRRACMWSWGSAPSILENAIEYLEASKS